MKIAAVLFAAGLTASAALADTVGVDDFDGGFNGLARTINPDNSAGNGAFPGSIFDVWGITNRSVNFDFADDTLNIFPGDTFGVLKDAKTDNVFGAEDITNPNFTGIATAQWSFSISGYANLSVCADFAAMGDFEAVNDLFNFTYSIDGSAPQPLFTGSVREDLNDFTYTLEGGTMIMLQDPYAMNGVVLNNDFQTLAASVAGTGSVLTITLTGEADGGSEVWLFDNLTVKGDAIPTPGAAFLLSLGGLAAARRRRS